MQRGKEQHFRGYAGRIAGGVFKPGDQVKILPSGFTAKIKTINPLHSLSVDEGIFEAFSPMSVTMTLDTDIDISRGDMIVRENNVPTVSQDLDIMVCWMSERPLVTGGKYSLKHTTKDVRCIVKDVRYKVDINTLHRTQGDTTIGMNDIGRVHLRVAQPLLCDTYQRNRATGSFILVDEFSHATLAAGMIVGTSVSELPGTGMLEMGGL